MCGIFGIVGKRNISDIIGSLQKLEYRGYDSCGIAYVYHKRCFLTKSVGSTKNLARQITNCEIDVAIGHTRWATHGLATVLNAHPQTSEKYRFFVVHNGMIDNYLELIDKYGFIMRSQTDTEVIVHLLDLYTQELGLIDALSKLKKEIKGNYAVVIIDRNENDKIYFLKNKSPLLLATDGSIFMIASDQCAFDEKMNITLLNDGNYGYLEKTNYKIYTDNENEHWNTFYKSEKTPSAEAYGYFMKDEIRYQPYMLQNIYEKYKNIDLNKLTKLINNCDEIIFVGAGSSFYAGSILKIIFEEKLKKRCHAIIASELAFYNTLDKNILYIFLSQSGETADLCDNISNIKNNNGIIVSLCNNVNSTLGYSSDYIFPLFAKEEISVASTKAFMAMIYVGSLICKSNYFDSCEVLSKSLEDVILQDDKIKRIAFDLANAKNAFFVGKNIDYCISQEGALKLREIAYIPSFAFQAGELKHGSIALIDEGAVAIIISSDKTTHQALLNCKEEIKSRNGIVYLITTYDETSDLYFKGSFLNLIITVQLLAYHTAILLDRNVDQPRNLAKSVTVL